MAVMTALDYPKFTSHLRMYNKAFDTIKFDIPLRYHFNGLLFSRTSEQVVGYKIDGRICIINYSLAGSTGSLGPCKYTIGSANKLEWLSDTQIIVYFGSSLALLSFPSLKEIQVYRTSPILSDKLAYSPLMYQVFPNHKLRIYNTDEATYIPGDVYKGKINQVLVPESIENFIYIVTEQKYIKKIESGSNKVTAVYDPVTDMVVQTGGSVAGHEDFTLKSIDTFFGSNSVLFVFYECFRTVDNERQYLFIKYNTEDKKSDIIVFDNSYGNFSAMPGGEFSGASTNYFKKDGTLEKYIVFSGSDTSVISLTNDSPITMNLVSRRVLLNSGKYFMVYQGFHYPNTRIAGSEGLPTSIMSL